MRRHQMIFHSLYLNPFNRIGKDRSMGAGPILRYTKKQGSDDFHELDFKCQVFAGQGMVGIQRDLII